MQAYYADAVPLDRMKQEQLRIGASRAEAEAVISKHSANEELVIEKLDHLCTLLADAGRYYANAPDTNRRDLNQSVFDRLYIDDEDLIGSDVAEPYRRVLSDSLALDLARDRKRVQTTIVRTADAESRQNEHDGIRRPRVEMPANGAQDGHSTSLGRFLRVERPSGIFPWEQKNLGPFKDRGSNDFLVVGLTGFEPATP
jgi:hypothetical protein